MNSLKFSVMPTSLGHPSRVSNCGGYRIEKMDGARSRFRYVLLVAHDPASLWGPYPTGKLWDGFVYAAARTTDHRTLRDAVRFARSMRGGDVEEALSRK
jgi:hypothetical protein